MTTPETNEISDTDLCQDHLSSQYVVELQLFFLRTVGRPRQDNRKQARWKIQCTFYTKIYK